MEIADLDPAVAELYKMELIFQDVRPSIGHYEMVVYEPVDPNPNCGLVPRHLPLLFRYWTEATVTSRARPDVWIWSPSDDLLRVRHVSRGSTGYAWGVADRGSAQAATAAGSLPDQLVQQLEDRLAQEQAEEAQEVYPGCHGQPRPQASGVLGRPVRYRVPRGPGRGQLPDHRASLFRDDSCRSHPRLCALHRCVHESRRSLRRGPAFAVRAHGPSTRTRHPIGHARARGPRLVRCASEGRCGTCIVDRLYWSLQ